MCVSHTHAARLFLAQSKLACFPNFAFTLYTYLPTREFTFFSDQVSSHTHPKCNSAYTPSPCSLQSQRTSLTGMLERLLASMTAAGLLAGAGRIIVAKVPIIKCTLAAGERVP